MKVKKYIIDVVCQYNTYIIVFRFAGLIIINVQLYYVMKHLDCSLINYFLLTFRKIKNFVVLGGKYMEVINKFEFDMYDYNCKTR